MQLELSLTPTLENSLPPAYQEQVVQDTVAVAVVPAELAVGLIAPTYLEVTPEAMAVTAATAVAAVAAAMVVEVATVAVRRLDYTYIIQR